MALNLFRWIKAAGCALALWLWAMAGALEPDWTVNAWGQPETVVDARLDPERCGAGGYYIEKRQQGGGEAELVFRTVLTPGQAHQFSIQVRRVAGEGDLDVFFRHAAPYYETTSIRTVVPSPEVRTVTLKGVYDSSGAGAVRVSLRKVGLSVCLSSPTLSKVPVDSVGSAEAWSTVAPRFFGIHLNKLGVHNGWPSFNPGIVRMWDTVTTWTDLQPTEAGTDWRNNPSAQRLDYFLGHTRKFNPEGSLLMTLGMTPAWAAADAPEVVQCRSPYGNRVCAPPRLPQWRRHVRELAERYKGRIRYWEIWNEADVGLHWQGRPEDMVAVVRAAAEELKRVDPANVVMGPNVTVNGYRLLNDFLRLGGGRYIDAISVHVYIGRSPSLGFTKIRNLREMVAAHGLALPIWNTETGLSCVPDVDCEAWRSGRGVVDGVSALGQALIGQAALGVVSMSYYTWEGGAVDAGGLPLVKSNFESPTKAGEVVERIASWLTGARVRWAAAPAEGVRRVALQRNGLDCFIAWSVAGGRPVPMAQLGGLARWEDILGSEIRADEAGRITFTTLPALACPTGSR